MAYAAPTNRLYLSYPGGLITQIRLNESLAETSIAAGAQPGGRAALALADARLNDAYGRDFATSALARPVERSDGSLSIGYLLHLPLLR